MTPPATAQANVGQQGEHLELREAQDRRRLALIERLGTIADLTHAKPLEGELGDIAYDLLREAAAQIASDRQHIAVSPAPASNEAPKQGGVTLYREIDALGGTGQGEWSEGYSAAIGDVLTLMDARGFSEHVEAVPATGQGGVAVPCGLTDNATRHLEIRSSVNRAIYKALHDYRMSNMVDDEGFGYPLLDLMSNEPPADIGSGEMEMVALADEIEAAIEAINAAPAQVQP
jgi:hypothetical protein